MEPHRVDARETKGESRRRSAPDTRREASAVEASLQWVTARIPPDLVREIEAHAKRSGTTRSEAIRECLAVGLETIRHRDGGPRRARGGAARSDRKRSSPARASRSAHLRNTAPPGPLGIPGRDREGQRGGADGRAAKR